MSQRLWKSAPPLSQAMSMAFRIESVTTMNLEGLEQHPDGAMLTFMAKYLAVRWYLARRIYEGHYGRSFGSPCGPLRRIFSSLHRSSGFNPVLFAIRASIQGPISIMLPPHASVLIPAKAS